MSHLIQQTSENTPPEDIIDIEEAEIAHQQSNESRFEMSHSIINNPMDKDQQITYLTGKLTEFCEKYMDSQDQLDGLTSKVEKYIESYTTKAPILAKQKESYEKMIITYNSLKNDYDNLCQKFENASDELYDSKEKQFEVLEQNSLLKGVNDYLISQIRQTINENQRLKLKENFETQNRIIDEESLKKSLFEFLEKLKSAQTKELRPLECLEGERLLFEKNKSLDHELGIYKEKVIELEESSSILNKTEMERFASLERFYAESEQEMMKIKSENANLKDTINSLTATEIDLTKNLEKLRIEAEKSKVENILLNQQSHYYQDDLHKALNDLKSLKDDLIIKDSIIKSLENSHLAESQFIENLKACLISEKETSKDLQQKIHDKERLLFESLENAKKQVETLIREKIDIFKLYKTVENELNQIRADYAEDTRSLKEKLEQTEFLVHQQITNEKYESALKYLDEKTKAIESLETELAKIKHKNTEVEVENDYLWQQVKSLEKETNDNQKLESREKYLLLCEDLLSHQRDAIETQRDIDLLRFQLGRYESELSDERELVLSLENSYLNEKRKVIETKQLHEELLKEYNELFTACQILLHQKESLQLEICQMREKAQQTIKSFNDREIEFLKKSNTSNEIIQDIQRHKDEIMKMKITNEGLKKIHEVNQAQNVENLRLLRECEERNLKLTDQCKHLRDIIISKKTDQTPDGMIKLVSVLHKANNFLNINNR